MFTIDDVIQANEDLSLAIEVYANACKPLKFKGMSFALEEAADDSKQEAKKGVLARLGAFIKKIIDWAMSFFKKRSDKRSGNVEAMVKSGGSYEELLAKAKVKGEKYREAGMATLGPPLRALMGSKALAMINDDESCILMLRIGGPQKLVEEASRFTQQIIKIFTTFTIGLENIVEGKQYRQGIEFIGFGAQVQNGTKPISIQELPGLLRYDKKAAVDILVNQIDKNQTAKTAMQAIEDFGEKAAKLLNASSSGEANYHPDDIRQLQKDIAEYVPIATKGLETAGNVVYSGFRSAVEVNKTLYGMGGEVRGIDDGELKKLMLKMGNGDVSAVPKQDVDAVLQYIALLIGPEFEVIKG